LNSDRADVLLELVLVVPLVLLLLGAALDFAFLRHEQFVLSEAARTAVRAVLVAPAFTPQAAAGSTEEAQQARYVSERYQRGITLARYVIAANGLDPDLYAYRIYDIARPDPGGRSPFHTVQFNVSAREENRFFVFPEAVFKPCLGASGIISGTVLSTSFSLADPEIDEECSPETTPDEEED